MSTLTSAALPPVPSSIASWIPPEIVDQIFHFYFESYKQDPYTRRSSSERNRLALVCRAWYPSVQRLLFQYVLVDRECLNRFMRASSSPRMVGQFVQSLEFNLRKGYDQQGMTPEALNRLFARVPNVGELTLSFDDADFLKPAHPGLIPLPNVRDLYLDSQRLQKSGLISFRQILRQTANITSLTLSATWSITNPSSTQSQLKPVNLPHLTHLSLQSEPLYSKLHLLNLLTKETLDGIDSLELNTEADFIGSRITEGTALPLLQLIGKKLRTLTLGELSDGNRDRYDTRMLQLCPSIETLILTRMPSITRLPPTVTKIIYKDQLSAYLDWLLVEPDPSEGMPGITQRDGDWKNVTTLQVEFGRAEWGQRDLRLRENWEKIKIVYARRNVNTVLNLTDRVLPDFPF